MRELKGQLIEETKFTSPYRMILAGSSGSGKTHFAGRLLQNKNLFTDYPRSVVYYFPCYLKKAPVRWHKTLDIPVSYQVGLPTKDELVNLPKQSLVVLDDSFDEAINNSAVDHLFRVISGKRKISVIIMTQNNFSKGKFGRDIRNSCNFAVLFRNCCDTSINENIARMAGLGKAYKAASLDSEGVKYPYMFIDQSQQGQLSNYRLYTDIFAQNKEVWSVDGMKGYVVPANDFEQIFDIIVEDKKSYTASVETKHEDTKRQSADYYQSESDGEWNPTYFKPKEKIDKRREQCDNQSEEWETSQIKITEKPRKSKRKRKQRRKSSSTESSESDEDRRRRAKKQPIKQPVQKPETEDDSSESDSSSRRQFDQYEGVIFQN